MTNKDEHTHVWRYEGYAKRVCASLWPQAEACGEVQVIKEDGGDWVIEVQSE